MARRARDLGGVVGPQDAEVRWFIPGALARELRPPGPGRVRTDLYHTGSLSPAAAWKRRGRGRRAELKVRAPGLAAVRVEGVGGIAERWHKVHPTGSPPGGDHWLPVTKRLWERPGLQVAEVEVDDATWVTLAVCANRARTAELRALVHRWRPSLEVAGMPMSYPTFLLLMRRTGAHAARGCGVGGVRSRWAG